MNKNMRLAVSVVFIVIIVLAVAITRFYSKSEKTVYSGAAQPEVEKLVGSDVDGNRIFQDSSGLYGIIDSSDRVIVSPEWRDLSFTDSGLCIASKHLKSSDLYGCIDYEGNIVVPFVYSSITAAAFPGKKLYFAQTADNGSYAVYDAGFTPCFSATWKECRADGENLILQTADGTYKYKVSNAGIALKESSTKGSAAGDIDFIIEIMDSRMLSMLSPQIIEAISDDIGGYLEYAYKRDETAPEGQAENRFSKCTPIFPDEKDITTILTDISDIRFRNIDVKDDVIFADVSLKAGTDVKYTENGKGKEFHNDYRAELKFAGRTSADIHITSGGFRKSKPDYPAPEPEEQQEEDGQPV